MKAQKKKYYVIISGEYQGVHYDTWDNIEPKSTKKSGVNAKCFEQDKIAATVYFEKQKIPNTEDKQGVEIISDILVPKNGYVVDGGCNQSSGEFDFQVYDLKDNALLYTSIKYPNGTNNIAEFFALMYVIKRLHNKTLTNSPIVYTDSTTALVWLKYKKCKSNSNNTKLQNKITELENWLKLNDISSITVSKWQTKIWGENPADFGRK